jgi:serine/threonine protein kinase/dienelactone hydrolase
MGVVYRARDERLERDVAIKVLPTGALHDEAARRRFRTEALALAKLSHPNIATVYDVGVQGGAISGPGSGFNTTATVDYLVMELVPGTPLSEKLKDGPLPIKEALTYCVQIAAALEDAHERGVVHRDLKPSNIMITPKGHVKVLDFGLAKLLAPAEIGDVDVTISTPETRGQIGTPMYMSPEQADGRRADVRTDLWSLGVVLYEMLTGKAPFQGDSGFSVLLAVVKETPKPLTESRADLPEGVARIVEKALQKDVSNRYQTAAEISRDCAAVLTRLSVAELTPASERDALRVSRNRLWIGIVLALIAAAGLGWFLWRSNRRDWASERGVPQVIQLFEDQRPLSAFLLMKEAEGFVPGDSRLAEIKEKHLRRVSVNSTPAGATVEIKDYYETDRSPKPHSGWYSLGRTPLKDVLIPDGYFRWRVTKEGAGQVTVAPSTDNAMTFDLSAEQAAPAGMVRVPAQEWTALIDFVGWMGPYSMPAYFLDKFEVTNKQYQEFIDKGGYDKKEYWREKLLLGGNELSWDDALKLFRDRTGRAAPATWEGGHYPDGQAEFPVTGVSWYEAAAYAAYAGKSLPALAQWYEAAPDDFNVFITQVSNIGQPSQQGPSAVGAFEGLGPYGTYDMAGNVQEWTSTATGKDSRVILGGSWDSQPYQYYDPAALSPFDRSTSNGFRCAKNVEPLPAAALGPMVPVGRDLSKAKPVSDEVFRAYKVIYAYPKTALNAKEEGITDDKRDWRVEKVTFAPAYEGQRMIAYLFLPKNVKQPYQTVVFFPSARVVGIPDSKDLGDIQFFDFIVQSGRAVLYPIYYNTYERTVKDMLPGTAAETTESIAQRYKDMARSIDYLETRTDFDVGKLAYLGVSMGAAEGVIYAELEDRIKTAVFLDGGFFLDQVKPGRDQVDFAPRLKKPILMVNGRYDFTFSLDKAQEPLFRMLGAPESDKKHVVLDTPHEIVQQKDQMVEVVLEWLDKYLGTVR